jgi:carbon-monoxide dehydrogenase small subunit
VKYPLSLRVNGAEHQCAVEARTLLVEVLRDVLGLTGTHVGCEDSTCGACTVLLDGAPVKSCTVLALQADGKAVVTVEGLDAAGEEARAVRRALGEPAGCGFCSAGMVLAGADVLSRFPRPSRGEIRAGLRGNLCRCIGHRRAVEAIEEAGRALRREGAAGLEA